MAGTFRTSQPDSGMSAVGGRVEVMIASPELPSLTLKGHLTTWITAKAFYAPVEHPKVWTNAPRREFMYCNDCWRRSLACENVGEPRGFEVIERGTAFAPFMGARGGPVTPDRDTGPRRRLN
jgi:hypothetical protein